MLQIGRLPLPLVPRCRVRKGPKVYLISASLTNDYNGSSSYSGLPFCSLGILYPCTPSGSPLFFLVELKIPRVHCRACSSRAELELHKLPRYLSTSARTLKHASVHRSGERRHLHTVVSFSRKRKTDLKVLNFRALLLLCFSNSSTDSTTLPSLSHHHNRFWTGDPL